MTKNYRQQPLIRKESDNDGDHWLKEFEKNLEKSAVQPRTQESLFDQINSVMNGAKSKHKSVAAAVEDMKERSGLTAYLNKVKVSNNPNTIKNASANLKDLVQMAKNCIDMEDWYNLGKTIAEIDMSEDNTKISGIESVRTMKYFHDKKLSNTKVPSDKLIDYVEGYNAGWGSTEEETSKDVEFIDKYLNKNASNDKLSKLEDEVASLVKEKRWLEVGKVCGKIFKMLSGTNQKTKAAKIKVPTVFSDDWALGFSQTSGKKTNENELKKFKDKFASDQNNVIDKKIDVDSKIVPLVIKKVPNIKNTLENYINDTKGTLAIPAIIEKIRSIHKSDVSEDKDWDDEELVKLISKMNLKAKADNPVTFHVETNLGTTDQLNDSDIDSANTDAFSSLNPVSF